MTDHATLIDDLRSIAAELVEIGEELGPSKPYYAHRLSGLGQDLSAKAAMIQHGDTFTERVSQAVVELAIRSWKVTMQSVSDYLDSESATVIGTVNTHAIDAEAAVEYAVHRLKALFPSTDRDTWEVLKVEIVVDEITSGGTS